MICLRLKYATSFFLVVLVAIMVSNDAAESPEFFESVLPPSTKPVEDFVDSSKASDMSFEEAAGDASSELTASDEEKLLQVLKQHNISPKIGGSAPPAIHLDGNRGSV